MTKPSIFRRLVAWYLDILLISTLLFAASPLLPEALNNWIVISIIWIVLVVAAEKLGLLSFGYFAMAMVYDEDDRLVLDPDYWPLAHWLMLLMGVGLFYDAMRGIGHGIVDYDFYYLFGVRIGREGQLSIMLTLSLLSVWAAIGVFRCKSWAPWLVLGLGAFTMANDASSLPLVQELLEAAKERGEAQRGRELPIDSSTLVEIYFAARAALYAFAVIVFVWLRDRFRYGGLV